jgi:hypothetical protein
MRFQLRGTRLLACVREGSQNFDAKQECYNTQVRCNGAGGPGTVFYYPVFGVCVIHVCRNAPVRCATGRLIQLRRNQHHSCGKTDRAKAFDLA